MFDGKTSLILLYVILVVLCLCVLLAIYAILIYNLNLLIVRNKGIKVRRILKTIQETNWTEIKNIYIFAFEGTEKIRIEKLKDRHINLGGVLVKIPKKIPNKRIFIDEGSGDSGGNIFEYFVPVRKTLPIRLQYNEEIITKIKKHYSKIIIEKNIQ